VTESRAACSRASVITSVTSSALRFMASRGASGEPAWLSFVYHSFARTRHRARRDAEP
jgi:hypothetical protein